MWLKDWGRAIIPSIAHPIQKLSNSSSCDWKTRHTKSCRQKNIKKDLKLLLFTGANRLEMHSLSLPLLSCFSMPNIYNEQRMGKIKFMATVSTNNFSKEFKFSFTLSALQYFDHKFTRAWRSFAYKNKQANKTEGSSGKQEFGIKKKKRQSDQKVEKYLSQIAWPLPFYSPTPSSKCGPNTIRVTDTNTL